MASRRAGAAVFLMLVIGTLATAGANTSGGQAQANPLSRPQILTVERQSSQPLTTLKRAPLIRLPATSFDPLPGEPPLDPSLRVTASFDPRHMTSHHYLVQMQPAQLEAGVAAVQAMGGTIVEPIPDWAYIVRMDGATAARVRGLAAVRWVGAFQPAYKIADCKMQIVDCGFSGELALKVKLFPYPPPTPSAARGVVAPPPPAEVGRGAVQQVDSSTLLLHLDASQLPALAADEQVRWIERQSSFTLHNDKVREISGANSVGSGLGLYGAGQVIALADTGLDTGNPNTLLADFAGRLVAAHALGRAGDWSDPNGHGTHTSGTALGNGRNSGSDPASHSYGGSFAGMAPEAQLVMQSIMDSNGGLGGIPTDLNTLFQQAYSDGARVHSNSWGSSGTGQYTSFSQEADQFVWSHPDMNIIFSAGNDGVDANGNGVVDLNSLSSPATAKDVLSVGASESERSSGGYQSPYGTLWPADFPANPIASDLPSNTRNGMAAFSSRGPTADGRFGPVIANVGTNVISDRSQVSGAGIGWGAYNAQYIYDGGTSMAAPGVAGAAALTREFYTQYAGTSASAALVRATLLNGASDMTPGQYGSGATEEMGPRPNNVEGWGRLDLSSLDLAEPQQIRFADNPTGLANAATIDYGIDVTNAGYPMHATLAWSDYPGYGLIDDLDLSLIAPNGSVYWGNGVSGGDRANNTETVDLANAPVGHYTLHIYAYRVQVPGGQQPYAVAVTAAMGGTPPTPTPTSTPKATPTALPCGVFFDVPTGYPFYQYIHDLSCSGVISGVSYGYYQPNSSATRAQFARMVVRGFGLPIVTPSSGYSFADVPPNYWAWQYIETAYANGIVSGTSLGHFSPDAAVTRAQTVRMVVRARGWPITSPATPDFSDVPSTYWAYQYIETAYAHHAISGVGGGLFAPDADISRGQLAKVLYNGINLP